MIVKQHRTLILRPSWNNITSVILLWVQKQLMHSAYQQFAASCFCRAQQQAPVNIISDRALVLLCQQKPRNASQLEEVEGLPANILQSHGQAILKTIDEWFDDLPLGLAPVSSVEVEELMV